MKKRGEWNRGARQHNYLRTLLLDKRVHDKWSIEQLTLVQRIMNIWTSTGVTPAESTLIIQSALHILALGLILMININRDLKAARDKQLQTYQHHLLFVFYTPPLGRRNVPNIRKLIK